MSVREDFPCQTDEAGAAITTHPGDNETNKSWRG